MEVEKRILNLAVKCKLTIWDVGEKHTREGHIAKNIKENN